MVADSDTIAREAIELIEVKYKVQKPVTDVFKAIDGDRVHSKRPNNFETTQFTIGDADNTISESAFKSTGKYETQRIEHCFLEKEAAIARPDGKGGIELFSQSQGVYEDRRQVAMILGLDEEKVRVYTCSKWWWVWRQGGLKHTRTNCFVCLYDEPTC